MRITRMATQRRASQWLIPSAISSSAPRPATWSRRSSRGAPSTTSSCRRPRCARSTTRWRWCGSTTSSSGSGGSPSGTPAASASRSTSPGPPGTGKTICAEALAYTLDKRLLVVRYAELESRWVGQTAKHVATVFRAAERQNAVLFFDEADAIAGRRFTVGERRLRAGGERDRQRAAARAGELRRRGDLRHQPRRQHRPRLRAPDPHPHPVRDAERGGARADLAGAAPRAEDAAGGRRGLPRSWRSAIPGAAATSRTRCSRPPRSRPPSPAPTPRSGSTSGTSSRGWRRCWRRRT